MSLFKKLKAKLPNLGIGLGLRRELAEETFANSRNIDWLEIIPENYMDLGGATRDRLLASLEIFPIVSHGINLSIASTDELNYDYLKSLKNLLDFINAPWWSDHLCFTSINNVYMHDLLPVPFNKEAVEHIVERVRRVQDFIERPFLLENISYYMSMPGTEMKETDFITEILEKSDCGLLLDINNVYVNSLNHKFDPNEYLQNIPLDRVVQIHLAGHKQIGQYVIDTHGAAIVDPVYRLLESVLKETHVQAIMLERDQNFPAFAEILNELATIRKIADSSAHFRSLREADNKSQSDLEQNSKQAQHFENKVYSFSSDKRGRELRVITQ